MVSGLLDLVAKGAKQVDLAHTVGCTSQHLGRILRGVPHAVSDDVGVKICELLGLPVEYSVETPRKYFFEVKYQGEDMKPLLQDGQVLFCEPVPINLIQPGDLVVCQFDEGKNGRKLTREAVRYWEPTENKIILKPENFLGKEYETTLPNINWVARILHPVRRMSVSEGRSAKSSRR